MSRKYTPQNRNAFIRTRETRNGKTRTETVKRDADSITAAVSTNPKTNSTQMFIDFVGFDGIKLSGSEARTLYRLLQKHYQVTDKTW